MAVDDRYNFHAVEKKWRRRWAEEGLYHAEVDPSRPKFYCLEMYPYPSGRLHMGHVRNYSIGDATARFHRMRGYNVLYPMGWDSFGLPAENAAIANKTHPAEWTNANIAAMREQMQRLAELDLLPVCEEKRPEPEPAPAPPGSPTPEPNGAAPAETPAPETPATGEPAPAPQEPQQITPVPEQAPQIPGQNCRVGA